MTNTNSIGLDTNILVHSHNKRSPLFEPAQAILKKSHDSPYSCSICHQNAPELYMTLTRSKPFNVEIQKAKKYMLAYLFSSSLKVLIPNARTLFLFEKITRQTKLRALTHIYDLFLAATFLSHGVTRLYSQNVTVFERVDDLEVVNPFE